MNTHTNRTKAASGTTRSTDGTIRRPAWFVWTDPVTRERLRVELWGSEAFLAHLEAVGFERVRGRSATSVRGPVDPRDCKERSVGGDAA
jgi:hypothetical protein